jgi:hypothetical protein
MMRAGPSRTAELSRFSDPPAARGWPSVCNPNACPPKDRRACSEVFVAKSAGEIFFINSTRDALLKKSLMTATKRQLNLTE